MQLQIKHNNGHITTRRIVNEPYAKKMIEEAVNHGVGYDEMLKRVIHSAEGETKTFAQQLGGVAGGEVITIVFKEGAAQYA